ncbi:YgiW/YdeI family stress tolerance OB fold protein [Telluria beijingensis]|uniref:YgiW/YdeI family stress tolerance OB fold protein n=1 Tax=Telluria beijingensis TaxID=3068633 RepID=UPI00279546ED|nr:NirD/YgiW/YdeI family stress tolerance protein [Massilia sp. REN29]
MKRFYQISCIAALLAGSAVAVAQNGAATTAAPAAAQPATPAANAALAAKPAPSGYTGPSGAPLMSAKDLLAKGKDDQYVRLKGKLTSHKGDEDYEFTDASGKMTVEIDSDRFPQGVTVDHNTLVELTGEFDKEMFGESKLDVEQIKVVGN